MAINPEKQTVKIYSNKTVYEAALDRIRWVFAEFPNVVVSVSGGKDSTVIYHLALQVARELGRLPLRCMWLDQEAEWQATVDSAKEMLSHPDVEPYWLQIPIKIESASSSTDSCPFIWNPDDEANWMRPKDPMAIHENKYGVDDFYKLFTAFPQVEWPGVRTAFLAGMRCEESPLRSVALTDKVSYKFVTWAKNLGFGKGRKKEDRNESNVNVTFYPIYDWSFGDVWHAIHANQWPYCKAYDEFYRFGVPRQGMRISAVHHEMAIRSLFIMQEIEPKTYEKLVHRIKGADSAGKFGAHGYFPSSLPQMFGNWQQYRDYLLEKLIDNEKWLATMRKQFDDHDAMCQGRTNMDDVAKCHVTAILTNDHLGIRVANFINNPSNLHIVYAYRKEKRDAKELSAAEAYLSVGQNDEDDDDQLTP